jgi:hypothetical protein
LEPSKRTFQRWSARFGERGSVNSLRYHPTDERLKSVSAAFQLCGTRISDQPIRSSWAYQRSASPCTVVSSWRKYQVPPRSWRVVWPS